MLTTPITPSRSQRLRHLIEPAHQTLMASGVIGAILAETIRLRPYITLLRALRAIHATMDARLPELPLRLPIAPLLRLPALDLDLRIWDPSFVVCTPPAEPLLATLEPHGLIGALYALEGSRHATPGVAARLARAFALPDATAGLSYHGNIDAQQWRHCNDAIDRLALTAQQEETVNHGAVAAMERLIACHQGIHGIEL